MFGFTASSTEHELRSRTASKNKDEARAALLKQRVPDEPAPAHAPPPVEPAFNDEGMQIGGELTRDQVMAFFERCIDDVNTDETLQVLRSAAVGPSGRLNEQRPNLLLIERQRKMLERMKIEREFGQAQLSQVPKRFADDKELLQRMSDFGEATQRTFVAVLRAMRPKDNATLRAEGDMSRDEILTFFDGCDTLMALPENKAALEARARETRQPPNAEIISMQREMLENLGWTQEHGVSCLNAIMVNYPDLMPRMQRFAQIAQMACREAVVGREAMRRQMEVQRMMMEQRQRMAEEVEAMSARDKRDFVARVKPQQEAHSKVLMGLAPPDRMKYMASLSSQEQADMTRLSMILGGPNGGGGGPGPGSCGCGHDHGDSGGPGHSHDHGQSLGHDQAEKAKEGGAAEKATTGTVAGGGEDGAGVDGGGGGCDEHEHCNGHDHHHRHENGDGGCDGHDHSHS